MNVIHGEALAVANSAGTAAPDWAAPAGACDCHIHVFDPRYAFIAGRNPGVATVADYRLFMRRLGLSRCILIAPSSYGTDNSCLLYALGEFGALARGVATITEATTDAELEQLHAAGVRGIRVNFGRTEIDIARLQRLAARIQPLNWHLQTHILADGLIAHEAALANLPVTLVIDHIGRAPQPGGHKHPVAGVLARLLANDNTWVKLSHYYPQHGSTYADYLPLAKQLITQRSDRLLWASDWPHGTQDIKPDGAALFNQIALWTDDPLIRQRILVDNPSALYWRD